MVLWLCGVSTINELRLLIRQRIHTHLIVHSKLIIKGVLWSQLLLWLNRLTSYVLVEMVIWLALGVLVVKGLKLSREVFFLNFIVRAIHYL